MIAVEAVAAGLVLAGGVAMDNVALLALKIACVWLATTVVIKRLHDVGMSGWRMLWAFLSVLAWAVVLAAALLIGLGDAAMDTGAIGYNLTLAGTVLPIFLATLWLHFKRGERGANRYGPEPAGWGFSHPAEAGFSTPADGLIAAAG